MVSWSVTKDFEKPSKKGLAIFGYLGGAWRTLERERGD
jgi:hypothetical protein